jgi:hypothetical protein
VTQCKTTSSKRSNYVHLTNSSFLPNALLKELTATEYGQKVGGFFNLNHTLADLDIQQNIIHSLSNRPEWVQRTDPASSVEDVLVALPWWLACNTARFPYWHGRPDTRNRALLRAMESCPGNRTLGGLSVQTILGTNA